MKINQKIDYLKTYYHLNDRKIRRILGVKKNVYEAIMRDETIPPIDQIRPLCEYFKLNAFYFMMENVDLKTTRELKTSDIVLDDMTYKMQEERINRALEQTSNNPELEKIVREEEPHEDYFRYEEE